MKMSVCFAIYTCHRRIKTTNWSRVTIFQMYFRPAERTMFKTRFPIERVARPAATLESNSSSSFCSSMVS